MTREALPSPKPARASRKPKAVSPSGPDLTLNRAAYDRLRQMIVTLALHPGEKISEVRMMGMLGSGRAPARYAMQRLASERLLRAVPRGGTVIRPLLIGEVQQAYQVRTSLERLAARLAARHANAAAIAHLEACFASAETAHEAGEPLQTSQSLHVFNEAVVATGANEILEVQMKVVMAVTERFEHYRASELKILRRSLVIERRLLDAITAHDPEAAERVIMDIAADRAAAVAELIDLELVVRPKAAGSPVA